MIVYGGKDGKSGQRTAYVQIATLFVVHMLGGAPYRLMFETFITHPFAVFQLLLSFSGSA
jgi:hypothetical protein